MRAFEMIYRDEVSAKAVSVFRYLLDRQGKYDFCYVSHRRMAGDYRGWFYPGKYPADCGGARAENGPRKLRGTGHLRGV